MEKKGEYLSLAQQRKLAVFLDSRKGIALKRNTRRAITNQIIVELITACGLWAEDLQELRIKDLPYHHGNPVIYTRDDKGDIARTVVITKALCESIASYIRTCRKNSKPGSYLVVNERGGRLSYHSLYSKLTTVGRAAGLPRLTSRMLRTVEVDGETLAANHQQQVEKMEQMFRDM